MIRFMPSVCLNSLAFFFFLAFGLSCLGPCALRLLLAFLASWRANLSRRSFYEGGSLQATAAAPRGSNAGTAIPARRNPCSGICHNAIRGLIWTVLVFMNSRVLERREAMDNFTFGVTMMVCGMGGTILTLWILSLVMALLGKIFPEKKEEK
jgi:hypothetical protein